ncbi:hypothetical protein B566_EDAN012339 [Ephemera danica]|nr:hypothetical protein B566_EDAN012339 [Ephemera danica]
MQGTAILLLLFVSNVLAKIGDRDPTTEKSPEIKPDVNPSTTIAPPTAAPTTVVPTTAAQTAPPTTTPRTPLNSSLAPHFVSISAHKIGRGNHIWINGATFDFNDWASGQPAYTSRNCVIMWSRKWYDIPCEDYTAYFICEQAP